MTFRVDVTVDVKQEVIPEDDTYWCVTIIFTDADHAWNDYDVPVSDTKQFLIDLHDELEELPNNVRDWIVSEVKSKMMQESL